MSLSYLQIYLIFVLYIMTQVKYGISQLDGTTEASVQNGTTTEAFHLQLNVTTETFPSQDGAAGNTESLDTTTVVLSRSSSKNENVTSENCTFKFCSCADFVKLGNVLCIDNEKEFFQSHRLYANMSPTSSPVTTTGSPRFRVATLVILDSQVTLDEDSLEGVIDLEEFTVLESGLQIIPDFSFVKDSIWQILIQSSRLSELVGTHLQNLTLVISFTFSHNAIRHIDDDVFKGTENVKRLDLSYNLLTSIPQTLLDPMKKLRKFVASHNNLLHVRFVFDVTLPKEILLDFNNISNANDVMTFSAEKYNELEHSRAEFGGDPFSRFWEINRLDLSHNSISRTHNSVISPSFYNIKGIPLFRIKQVILDGNLLQDLDMTLRRCRVVEFRASKNRLESLSSGDFSMLHDTVDLRLRDNKILRIDPDVFQPIRFTLQRLDLSSNSITDLNGSIRYLSELISLDVSYNAIESFSQDEFTGLYALSELFLQYNQIRMLAQLQHLSQLRQLNIYHNQIQFIRPQQLPPSLHASRAISLGDNSFNCDCRLQPFTDWARDKEREFVAISPELCLRSDLGNRTWESEECPDLCKCSCRDDFMFVDCSSKSLLAVPQFLRKDAVKGNKTVGSDVIMRQNRDSPLHFEGRVRGINLENNSLESLEGFRLPPNLTLLYLAHNKLGRLPEALLDYSPGLKQVSLAGNPWRCDCSTLTFKKWLTSNNVIFRDLDAIRCGPSEKESVAGRAVWHLTDLDLCPSTPIGLIVSVAIGILSFIIVCLSAKVLFMRYELNIRVFLYYHGLTLAREDDIDQEKMFDVFVSFSHADDEFVIKDIIPVIERKDPDIRLCLHYRHFTAGELILDNITRAVCSSKRTLLILTRNFLESEWCLQEFRTAHRQSMKDKVHRIIAVKVGELPKEIDPTIQVYLDCTTYLVWGEVNFWNKLLFVIPTRNARKKETFVQDYPDL